mmetsp:Transcript_53888/g.148590  ORF Transcript_53888/g.148590 Transcript_53888/m.148590 type:complete len:265 (-) Transcript_53888:403-1197(-)
MTDIWLGGYSRAVAMRRIPQATLLAVIHDTGFKLGVGGVSVLNHFYGRDDVPIGAFRGGEGNPDFTAADPLWTNHGKGVYVEELLDQFPSPLRTSLDAENAVDVYRRALQTSEDSSVVIASIGFLTTIRELLLSSADATSPLDGVDLVRTKVKHAVVMGGHRTTGLEWNLGAVGSALLHRPAKHDAVTHATRRGTHSSTTHTRTTQQHHTVATASEPIGSDNPFVSFPHTLRTVRCQRRRLRRRLWPIQEHWLDQRKGAAAMAH